MSDLEERVARWNWKERSALLGVLLMGLFGHWWRDDPATFAFGAILALPLAVSNFVAAHRYLRTALKEHEGDGR